MQYTNRAEFRKNMRKYMDDITEEDDIIIVEHGKKIKGVAVVSLRRFEEIQELLKNLSGNGVIQPQAVPDEDTLQALQNQVDGTTSDIRESEALPF